MESSKNWFLIDDSNAEFKRKWTVQCLALEANERLAILHDFTGSILPS